MNGSDRKDRIPSPSGSSSHGNVVDHDAPGGSCSLGFCTSSSNHHHHQSTDMEGSSSVTEHPKDHVDGLAGKKNFGDRESSRSSRSREAKCRCVWVCCRWLSILNFDFFIASVRSGPWHWRRRARRYGSLLNLLGDCVGCIGAIPCCPCPNPYRNVGQGESIPSENVLILSQTMVAGAVGLVSRFGKFYKAVDPGLAKVNVCTESLRIVDVKIQIAAIEGRPSSRVTMSMLKCVSFLS